MTCRLCGGILCLLGQLGLRKHYRCRNCGMDWSKESRPRKRRAKSCNDCGETYPCRGVLQGTHSFKGI